jgi:hypothetical protein
MMNFIVLEELLHKENPTSNEEDELLKEQSNKSFLLENDLRMTISY